MYTYIYTCYIYIYIYTHTHTYTHTPLFQAEDAAEVKERQRRAAWAKVNSLAHTHTYIQTYIQRRDIQRRVAWAKVNPLAHTHSHTLSLSLTLARTRTHKDALHGPR
jgi:hypothetical protein